MHKTYYVLGRLQREAGRARAALYERVRGEVQHRLVAGAPLPRRVRHWVARPRETARQALVRMARGAPLPLPPPDVADVRCLAVVVPPDGAHLAQCERVAPAGAGDFDLLALRACLPRGPDLELARRCVARIQVARRLLYAARAPPPPVSDAALDAYRGVLEAQRLLAPRLRELAAELCRLYHRPPHAAAHVFPDGWRVAFRRRNRYDWDGLLLRHGGGPRRRGPPRFLVGVV